MKGTIVGVDLARNVIQVFVLTNKKVHSNTEMIPNGFTGWLVNSAPVTIVFEGLRL